MENVNLSEQINKVRGELSKETNELHTVEGNLKRKEEEVRHSEIELKKAQDVHNKLAQEASVLKKKEDELLHNRNQLEVEVKEFTKELEDLKRNTKR